MRVKLSLRILEKPAQQLGRQSLLSLPLAITSEQWKSQEFIFCAG